MIKQFFTYASILGFLSVGQVAASPFSISASSVTDDDGSLSFTLSGNTANRTGQLVYDEQEPAANGFDFTQTSWTDSNATWGVSNGSTFIDGLGLVERSAMFTVSDPHFPYTIDTGSDQTSATGYTFNFYLDEIFAPDGTPIEFDIGSATPILLPQTGFRELYADVTGDPLSLVPLPSAAPLFGAALVALGAVGYGMKRKAAAAA